MTQAVVRCDGRRRRVRLSGRTVTSSDTTRRPPIVSDGQQNTTAAHSSGRSRVQLVNLTNIAAYVVVRIAWCRCLGQASGEFQPRCLNGRSCLLQSPGTRGMSPEES